MTRSTQERNDSQQQPFTRKGNFMKILMHALIFRIISTAGIAQQAQTLSDEFYQQVKGDRRIFQPSLACRYSASGNTLAKILSTLRNWRSSEKDSAICSGVRTARISGSASIAARKSDSSSQARMAWACTVL